MTIRARDHYLERVENHILFAGDTCNTNTLLYLEGNCTIDEYLRSLKKLKRMEKE